MLQHVSLLIFPFCLTMMLRQVRNEEVLLLNDTRVDGVCSRPNLPPNSKIRFASPEKIKFAENETIYVLCEDQQFPHHAQKQVCKHGLWEGPPARCGKAVNSNVIKLNAFSCHDISKTLLSLDLNQTEETPYPLPPNSFHFTRVPDSVVLSLFNSNCYRWIIEFDQYIEIAFLLIDINLVKLANKEVPKVKAYVEHRTCNLQHTSYQLIEQDEIYGNYFFCNLKPGLANASNADNWKVNKVIFEIETITNRTMGLEAVFVGETYKKQIKHGSNKNSFVTDCGKLGIYRTGVLEQVEIRHVQIICNDSYIDAAGVGTKHTFTCDANAQWHGEWPECIPKQTCPKEEITEGLDSSVIIERVSNVYYRNNTEWYAIDYSWVQYACAELDAIMVGKSDRLCRDGRWSNKVPHCTQALNTGSMTIIVIVVILTILVTVFSLIVYLSIKFHTKKIHRKLETTKSEIEANALNKQLSTEYYTDIGLETIYEDCKELYHTPMYEIADDVRYEVEPHLANTPALEPEYLTMTEGIIRSVTTRVQTDFNEYSN